MVFWRKMTESKDGDVRKLASRVRPTIRVEEISVDEYKTYTSNVYHKEVTKARTIDPDVLQPDGSVLRLSQLSTEYKQAREAYLRNKSGPHYYRVIDS